MECHLKYSVFMFLNAENPLKEYFILKIGMIYWIEYKAYDLFSLSHISAFFNTYLIIKGFDVSLLCPSGYKLQILVFTQVKPLSLIIFIHNVSLLTCI